MNPPVARFVSRLRTSVRLIYYGSGYISRQAFWVLGVVLGSFYLAVYLLIAVPWLIYLRF